MARRRPRAGQDRTEPGRARANDLIGHSLEHVEHRLERVEQGLEHGLEQVEQRLEQLGQAIRPKLRGWLHAGTFPLSVAAGVVLVVLSPTPQARVSTAVFAITASLLFGVSALYHRRHWGPWAEGFLKRFDHANIFLIIAGSYTPFSVLLLPPGQARVLLWIVWTGALLGVAFRVIWVGAPRWLYVPVYIALGWVAVVYLPDFLAGGGTAVMVLVAVGGLLYTLGALVYGVKRPNPSPRWFGFHEVFHALTVVAFIVHYVAVSLASYTSAG